MDADETIARLCKEHGVSRGFGERLRHLVRRALESNEERRARLLGVVERSFAEEARRLARTSPRRLSEKERQLLATVADILHAWEPPLWMKDWQRPGGGAESA